jgi:hypothetical protein
MSVETCSKGVFVFFLKYGKCPCFLRYASSKSIGVDGSGLSREVFDVAGFKM